MYVCRWEKQKYRLLCFLKVSHGLNFTIDKKKKIVEVFLKQIQTCQKKKCFQYILLFWISIQFMGLLMDITAYHCFDSEAVVQWYGSHP